MITLQRKIYFSLFTAILSLISAGIICRLAVFHGDSYYENIRINLLNDLPKFIQQPYLNYINNPDLEEINNASFRQESEAAIKKEEDCFRVIFIGGSTTYGEVRPYHNTTPKLVEMILNDSLELLQTKFSKVECLNAGLPAATSAELLTHYGFKLLYFNPDLIIINSGLNDAVLQYLSKRYYSPDYSHIRTLFSDYPVSLSTKFLLKSRLFAAFYIFYYKNLIEKHFDSNVFFSPKEKRNWFYYGTDSINNLSYNGFYNNIRSLILVAQSRNSKVLLLSEVIEPKSKCSNEFDSLLIHVSTEFEKNKQLLGLLSMETGVPICKLKKEDFPIDFFVECDALHMNEKGEKKKAQIVSHLILRRFLQ